jgi:hypothetical protein
MGAVGCVYMAGMTPVGIAFAPPIVREAVRASASAGRDVGPACGAGSSGTGFRWMSGGDVGFNGSYDGAVPLFAGALGVTVLLELLDEP